MAEPFDPLPPQWISPYNGKGSLVFPQDNQHISRIRHLTIITETEFQDLCPKFIDFLARTRALEVIVIRWHALDWFRLKETDLQALLRVLSLRSLKELQVHVAANFPLDLLQHFTGKKLHISANITLLSVALLTKGVNVSQWGFLKDISVCGTQNIQELRTLTEWRSDNARKCLESIKRIRFNTSWRDANARPEAVMRVLGSFLNQAGVLIKRLEELSITDLQLYHFNGAQITQPDLQYITSLKRLYLSLGASPKGDETNMNSMDSTLRRWLFPILLNLPCPLILEAVHITFSFVVPFPWPVDLHDWMLKMSATLEALLLTRFVRLRTANLTFELYNAHTKPFAWNDFNEQIQPKNLLIQGVKCNFKVYVYRP